MLVVAVREAVTTTPTCYLKGLEPLQELSVTHPRKQNYGC